MFYNFFMNKKYLENEKDVFEELLNTLAKEFEFKIPKNINKKDKINMLNTFLAYFNVGQLNEYIVDLQDKYLAIQSSKKEYIDLNDFVKIKDDGCLNLFNIKADLLVVFTDKLLGGEPDLLSINNQFAINGGIQINEDIYKLIKKDYGITKFDKPYIVDGYNLPFEYVCKICVKNITKQTSDEEIKLINSFNKLINLIKEKNIKNIVVYFKEIYKYNFNEEFLNNFNKYIIKQFKKKKINFILI